MKLSTILFKQLNEQILGETNGSIITPMLVEPAAKGRQISEVAAQNVNL